MTTISTRRRATVLAAGLLSVGALFASAGSALAGPADAGCGNGNGECYVTDPSGIKQVRVYSGNTLSGVTFANGGVKVTAKYDINKGQATWIQIQDGDGHVHSFKPYTIYPQ